MVILRENGAPREIRTPDPQVRSLILYPAELWVPLEGVSLRYDLEDWKRKHLIVGI